MLDTLVAIKNNNKIKILHNDLEYVDSLKKHSKTLLNTGKCVNELKITFDDLLNGKKSVVFCFSDSSASNSNRHSHFTVAIACTQTFVDE